MPRLRLHDIDDAEDYARAGIAKQCRAWGSQLRRGDIEDLGQHVLAEMWRASERFNPETGGSFAKYCRGVIPRAAVSWYRTRFLDTRNQHRYTDAEWDRILALKHKVLSFDAPITPDADDSLGDLVGSNDRDLEAIDLAGAGGPLARTVDERDWDYAVIRAQARRDGGLRPRLRHGSSTRR